MLVITVSYEQAFRIGEAVVSIEKYGGNRMRVYIDAPPEIPIHRSNNAKEIKKKREKNAKAAKSAEAENATKNILKDLESI